MADFMFFMGFLACLAIACAVVGGIVWLIGEIFALRRNATYETEERKQLRDKLYKLEDRILNLEYPKATKP